ncbi:hypothetical protein [Flavobacterium anhuiense]|uniref:hypothetical protein n=1 Tax=Flavobacterium anhuiense TaxID=459526 RepID=UPI003D984184
MAKKIIISGIGPGPAGVGRVLEYLIENSQNFSFVYPAMGRKISIKDCILKLEFLKLFLCFVLIFKYYCKTIFYNSKLYFFKNKDLIVLHPQSIGFRKLERLIKRNNLSIYVMDNNFFCIKSYNYLKSIEKPCLLCLDMQYNNAVKNSCDSFPVYYSYEEYFDFLNVIKANIDKINFLTQNFGQKELLKKQFGENLLIREVGLLTSDLFEDSKLWVSENCKKYDVVFHGDSNSAKGSKYIYELAKYLPEYIFLFPFESQFEEKIDNVEFVKMSWTTGLKECVLNSKLTLCPSIWSAPIEGSVLKTLKLGVALGIFDAEYSFGKEIPDDSVLRLSGNITNDVALIRQFITLKSYTSVGIKGKNYINKKVAKMTLTYNEIFNS